MKDYSRNDYIAYRLEKAFETFSAAEVLVKDKLWNSAVNRLYYACFYAVSALLVSENLKAFTHNGVKTQFFSKYVKSGIIDKSYSKLYSNLFDWRQKGDYSDFFDLTEQDIVPLVKPTEELIRLIKVLLDK